jgi:hypothetical protein
MQTVRLRLIGSQTDTDSLIAILHGLEGVDRVEQVGDLMDHMDDEDSSSSGLTDDIGPGLREIEVEVSDAVLAERVRHLAAAVAEKLGASLEFVDEF